MVWESIKRFFGGERHDVSKVPALSWLKPEQNPWGVSVLDVRPVTLTFTALSQDRQCAENSLSFGKEDGRIFIGQRPQVDRIIKASLRFPIDRRLFDGVLFAPREMEHKWAIFYHRRQIICVRSWSRLVFAVANADEYDDHIEISSIRGTFFTENEESAFTVRVLDYLLRTHALKMNYPAPIAAGLENDPEETALWCMSAFGRLALFATPHEFARDDPKEPLRTNSLLHIDVARGDIAAVEAHLAAGIPIDLLANDGLTPLHWALARNDLTMTKLLLERGSLIDVRSAERATPLMNVVQEGEIDKVIYLLDQGADVNAYDQRGFTALHRAAELGNVDMVRLLLDRGATANPEAKGHTPMSLATAHGHAEIVALLGQ